MQYFWLWFMFMMVMVILGRESKLDNLEYLDCEMSEGIKRIPANRVTDFIDETWIFDNGSAKNCTPTYKR